ncbi:MULTISPECIES: 16S rRNA (adenine(1518)-N(6)/adenine(1519)-N(6))-dimethyltransferase RsmA [Candidatus Ichthyocystis]|uniref:16S rRNA (adenine(1518)-N(6)/adenine(1519)-N(6))- dimethyltransferase RsmA n=1 Tax=Candidatus Ichthyocystis TaxID=2929841 RepID=UPI000A76A36B|nr:MULTISPECIES: 16S rRNA (adenine(1518)-N(6)/adenine(1519)-N(6))-dimethyltransferase RsmA [Ichthyocystis]
MPRAKKKWGQNFLCDSNVIKSIISAINPSCHDPFLEIGPGYGALTDYLVDISNNVIAVEIDRECVQSLKKRHNNLVILNQNILHLDWSCLSGKKRIVGNLPYYISSKLLELFCNHHSNFIDIHIMLQREVAKRILSNPGDVEFSRISIFVQAYFDVEHIFDIEPGCFRPSPSVVSSFIRLKTKSNPRPISNLCYSIIKSAFSQRRKMIRNSLSSFFSELNFEKMGIDSTKRAQEMSREEYETMAVFFSKIGKNC